MSSLIVVRSASNATPVTTFSFSILADDTYHLVQFWCNLNTAGKSALCWDMKFTIRQTPIFIVWLFIELIKPWIWHMNRALGAVNSCAVVIYWDLERLHLIFIVTSTTLSKYPWHSMSLDHLQQTLTCKCSHSPWSSIRGYNIDPDYFISHFDSSTLNSWPHCRAPKTLAGAWSYANYFSSITYN